MVDTQEKIDAILPQIDKMLKDGLVTLEKVHVLRYSPHPS
jgi:PII-like signaling protein